MSLSLPDEESDAIGLAAPAQARGDSLKPMHVLVLGLRGVVNVQGGIETHARMLYPLLARMGYRVEVVQRSQYFEKKSRPEKWHGVKLTYMWSPRKPGFEAAVHTLLGLGYAALARPDVLHLHAIGPAFLAPFARLLGLRVVVTHHAEDYRREKWKGVARTILKLGERLGMRYAHERIVVSSVLRERMASKYGVKVNFIPNGAPRALRTRGRGALERFGLTEARYVLCVARLEMTKRQLDLIDAFEMAKLPGWKLVLVGGLDLDDGYCRELRRRACANPRIVLTGFQRGVSLRELYSHCRMFVLPSSMEGHPIALLEALSYGVPVLASAIPEHLILPIPRSCFFGVGDKAELARLMTRMATSENDSEEARLAVRERYSWRRAAELTRLVYESALAGQAARSRRVREAS